jgi:hypothetical protein
MRKTRTSEYPVSCPATSKSTSADAQERLWDKSKQPETALSDSEDEGTGGRRHRQNHKEDGSGSGPRRKSKSKSGSAKGPTPPVQSNGTNGGTALAGGVTNGSAGAVVAPSTDNVSVKVDQDADGDVNMVSK